MLPTLAILMAPPAVAFLAYLRLAGALDGAAHVLFAGALAFAALVIAHARDIARAPFGVPWWALSFPSAGLTLATMAYGERIGSAAVVHAGLALWAVLLALIAFLLVRTTVALVGGKLLVPEPPMPAPAGHGKA
jgi:tellurite resistance protein